MRLFSASEPLSAEVFDSCSPSTWAELDEAFGFPNGQTSSGFQTEVFLIDGGRIAAYGEPNPYDESISHSVCRVNEYFDYRS